MNECTFVLTRVIQIQVRVEEHLIIRSWFVVLLLCDEIIIYINLLHAQNMPRSKRNKSLVTSKEGTLAWPGTYSCAVDAYTFVSPVFIKSPSKR